MNLSSIIISLSEIRSLAETVRYTAGGKIANALCCFQNDEHFAKGLRRDNPDMDFFFL